MPFDFNGKKPEHTSTSPRSPSPSPSGGGFQNRPSGRRGDEPRGFAPEPDKAVGHSYGFQGRPERSDSPHMPPPTPGLRPGRARSAKRPALRGSAPSIPWNIVIPLLLIVAVVALGVIYREAILEFFSELLRLIIVILIVFFILKMLLFGGGRK